MILMRDTSRDGGWGDKGGRRDDGSLRWRWEYVRQRKVVLGGRWTVGCFKVLGGRGTV